MARSSERAWVARDSDLHDTLASGHRVPELDDRHAERQHRTEPHNASIGPVHFALPIQHHVRVVDLWNAHLPCVDLRQR